MLISKSWMGLVLVRGGGLAKHLSGLRNVSMNTSQGGSSQAVRRNATDAVNVLLCEGGAATREVKLNSYQI